MKIKLIEIEAESAARQGLESCHPKTDRETTPAEKYTRDTLAPLVLAQLFKEQGTPKQKHQARELARSCVSFGCVCGSLLWVRYSTEEEIITLADGFRPACVGWVRGCDLLCLFTEKEETERAYIVRFEY